MNIIVVIFCSAVAAYAISATKSVIINSIKYHKERCEERVAIFRMLKFIKAGKLDEATATGNEALGMGQWSEVKP